MLLHNLLYQRQANAGIAAVIIYCKRLKHHEYFVMIFRCDARPVIGYREFTILTLIMHRNLYMAVFIVSVFDAVPYQVGEHLVKV